MDILDSAKRQAILERKRTISNNLMLAGVVSAYFGLKKGEKPPMPWDYEPDLFKEERERYEKREHDKAVEDTKNSRKAFAARRKERLKQEGGE
ncbi:MAG: hypothetical protein IJ899_20820 [Blautia sp.]|nr:hypothetical protein [Blautia sp.]